MELIDLVKRTTFVWYEYKWASAPIVSPTLVEWEAATERENFGIYTGDDERERSIEY